MPTDRASDEIKKSMAYDLLQIIDENPEKDSYTADEIRKIIRLYITSITK